MLNSDSKEQIVDRIATLVSKIQKDEKIGTAFEKYETEYLWELGDTILEYRKLSSNKTDITGEIIRRLRARSIMSLPLLLKNAETARKSWTTEEAYLQVAKGVSYGKLKAILPIFDSDFASRVKMDRDDLENLARTLKDLTYEQVLEQARKLRQKYDPEGIEVDFDELYSNLYSVNERLAQIVESNNENAINSYRGKYPSALIQNARRLISAMKNEDMFQRLIKSVPKKFGGFLDPSASDFDGEFAKLVNALSLIREGTPSLREQLRQRVGISCLGELSTLLKALSDDEELQRYMRGKRLLEQIRASGIKGGS